MNCPLPSSLESNTPKHELKIPEESAVIGLPKRLGNEQINRIEEVLNIRGIGVHIYDSLKDLNKYCDLAITLDEPDTALAFPQLRIEKSHSDEQLLRDAINSFNKYIHGKTKERSISILVAEDNLLNQKIMGMLLEKNRFLINYGSQWARSRRCL